MADALDKPSIYIESTIPSYLTAWPSPDLIMAARQQLTRDWWQTAPDHFRLLISQTVLDEVISGDPEAAERRLASTRGIEILPLVPDILSLSRDYISLLSFPPKAYNDAVHLVYAVSFEIDYVVTWNMRHLANSKTMRAMTEFNIARGFHVPLIVTPEYLVDQGEEP
jgi:predicted nucleic acid-binding protein